MHKSLFIVFSVFPKFTKLQSSMASLVLLLSEFIRQRDPNLALATTTLTPPSFSSASCSVRANSAARKPERNEAAGKNDYDTEEDPLELKVTAKRRGW